MSKLVDAVKRYYEEHQLERFVPWKRRVCEYCKYPLSEKVREKTLPSGKKKQVYCCNLCYELKENRVAKAETV